MHVTRLTGYLVDQQMHYYHDVSYIREEGKRILTPYDSSVSCRALSVAIFSPSPAARTTNRPSRIVAVAAPHSFFLSVVLFRFPVACTMQHQCTLHVLCLKFYYFERIRSLSNCINVLYRADNLFLPCI